MSVVPADADWVGPLYIATETKRENTKLFVTLLGYALQIDVDAPDGTPLFLADNGKFALEGQRCVGSVIGNDHPDKGPIAHLAPGQCITVVKQDLEWIDIEDGDEWDAQVASEDVVVAVEIPEDEEHLVGLLFDNEPNPLTLDPEDDHLTATLALVEDEPEKED